MAFKTAAWSRLAGKDLKNGGLNAKGVASYRKANPGSNLKMGVDKVAKTQDGKPTRLALASRKWNKPAPKTVEQAHKLAAFGRRLLESAKRMKDKKK
jgi:hypothetical protein